jgi:hypothetical protein
MTLLSKILLIISGIVVMGLFGFIIYQQIEMKSMQTQITASVVAQQTLLDNITRSSSQYATQQSLDSLAASVGVSLTTIQQNVSSLNATISGLNNVVVSSGGQTSTSVPSSGTTPNPAPPAASTVDCNGTQIPCPNADPYNYQKAAQTLSLNETFGTSQVPIGSTTFSAWQQNPWAVNIDPRTYDVANVLATDQSGKQYVYNTFSITTAGKTYTLPIKSAQFVQQFPAKTFSWWNPRLVMSVSGLADITHPKADFAPGIGVGVMSYGSSLASPDLSILQLGIGYAALTKTPTVSLNPISYNIGKSIPGHLVDNTYIGPSIQMGFNGNFYAGAALSVGF